MCPYYWCMALSGRRSSCQNMCRIHPRNTLHLEGQTQCRHNSLVEHHGSNATQLCMPYLVRNNSEPLFLHLLADGLWLRRICLLSFGGVVRQAAQWSSSDRPGQLSARSAALSYCTQTHNIFSVCLVILRRTPSDWQAGVTACLIAGTDPSCQPTISHSRMKSLTWAPQNRQ